MSPELSTFLTANATVLIIVVGLLAAIGLVQWRKVRVVEQETELKQAMLDKGVPVADIEKAMASKPPARRGVVEQFGALSGGAKAGVIAGFVIVMVVTVSCLAGAISSIAFWSHVRHQQAAPPSRVLNEPQPPPVEKADAITGHAFYLDLQPAANQKLADVVGDNDHSLAALPQKRREFGGVPFQVGPRYVRLRGKNRPELPAEATGIRVGLAFDKLHIFHGTEYGAFGNATHRFHVPDGTEIGRYRVRFTDDAEEAIPIVYGEDVRDAWNWDHSRPVTRGRVVWTGKSAGATREGATLRLYLSTWVNPRPDVVVESIDFISVTDTAASPLCIAMTAERTVK